jgi:hypothetical protein
MTKTILQIVPRLPGENDGVGEYAHILAQRLSDLCQGKTVFATADSALTQKNFDHVILHYVNYGYQKRGVPFALLSILHEIRARCRGRFLTIFHELYASGPPWKSAFWLRPLQMQIAKSIALISDAAIVSSETLLRMLRRLAPETTVSIHPVLSNFGEPRLSGDQLANRDPHRWVICGGTALVERSLRSFRAIVDRIPDDVALRELFVVGGKANDKIRALIVDLLHHTANSPWRANIRAEYLPEIDAAEASQILSSCSFAWLDYFHRRNVPTDIILKSSVFAALCAHGVITIFSQKPRAITVEGDALSAHFFVDPPHCELPALAEQAHVATEIYNWYHRRASSENLVCGIAKALELTAERERTDPAMTNE